MSQLKTSQKINNLIQFIQSMPSFGDNDDDEKLDNTSEKKIDIDQQLLQPSKYYITTAINYTNGKPHIGHAYEALTTCIIARYHRIFGRDVFFLTGTDEHGQKVANTANEQGFKPKEFCDMNVKAFKELNNKLNISNDYYIRTTDSDHYILAKKMFKTAFDNGDIYLSKYIGWYNVKEETYVTETEAKKTNYINPINKQPYEKHEEESYFFKMSKFKDRLIKHIKENKNFIMPSNSRKFVLGRLKKEGLSDLCVSRSTFNWGIPVPIDDKHIIYVWFDALSNYLTGIKYFDNNDPQNLKRFWPADCHIIGRDIVWFHCVIWPCILMSCNIPLAKTVFCHGFVNDKNGEKMSKSLKNVIDPNDLLKHYQPDTLRYFIASQATYGEDMRWNNTDLENRHDAHLTHIYGNLVNRTLKLTDKYCNSIIPNVKSLNIFNINKLKLEMDKSMKIFDLLNSTNIVMDRLRECNDWLAKKEPWKMKDNNKRLIIVKTVLESIYILTHFMEPFTPDACQKVFYFLNTPKISIIKLNNYNNLVAGTKINKHELLFHQFSSKFIKKEANKDKPVIADIFFKIGFIKEVDIHPNNPNSYLLKVDVGEPKSRTIVTGLVKYCKNEELLNKKVIIFANIKFEKFQGIKSEGMLMSAATKDVVKPLIINDDKVKIGDRLLWNDIDLSEWKCKDSLKIKGSKSIWVNDIAPTLKINNDGLFCWNDKPFTVGDSTISSKLINAGVR